MKEYSNRKFFEDKITELTYACLEKTGKITMCVEIGNESYQLLIQKMMQGRLSKESVYTATHGRIARNLFQGETLSKKISENFQKIFKKFSENSQNIFKNI